MEPARPQQSPQVPADRAAAERDTLLELLAVFTHDLSNPLQSITVLCELGMDGPGSEDITAQCLSAAERMRALIHGLSGFTRGLDRPSEISLVGDRLQSLLARRFERHLLKASFDYTTISSKLAPAELEMCMAAICLGIIATASERRARGEFSLSTLHVDDELAIEIVCVDEDGSALTPSQAHLERARAIGGDTIGIFLEDSTIRLRFGSPR